ncbi:IclR family transcriptional regulator [Petropleomorpha daqingensis]|uniref:DNA-binding IclR family transcriptional regulator n=1 Tax=Petropleomorpha daqingensis TaxID=2026353 RepID=A0A853CK43_9ACTN|nr:IclR family transcriptional regulator C-terminal domain-containing protein [Petropleomorpha daqingensis]NYJ07249.1 DNA-binding IclR family transcriptional regulator [Petropleomorpha daqingensis]
MTPAVDRGLTGRQPKAVQSALAILEAVARAGAGVTAKEVAEDVGLPPATTYRLLNLLVGEEYLVRLPDLHGFALGRKVAGLAGPSVAPALSTAAREVVAELRSRVRSGIHLVLYTPTALRCVDVDPDHPLQAPELVERHLHASAAGKLLLAEQPDWQELVHAQRLHRLTDRTVTRAADLDAELRAIRGGGCAVQAGQVHEDLACCAVPVRAPAGALVAALVVTVRSTDPAAAVAHAGLVREFTARLGPLLG